MRKLPIQIIYLWAIYENSKSLRKTKSKITKTAIPKMSYTRLQKTVEYLTNDVDLITDLTDIFVLEDYSKSSDNDYDIQSYTIPHLGKYSKYLQMGIETNLITGVLDFEKFHQKENKSNFYRHNLKLTTRGKLYLLFQLEKIESNVRNRIKNKIKECNDLKEFDLIYSSIEKNESLDYDEDSSLQFLGLLPALSEINLKNLKSNLFNLDKDYAIKNVRFSKTEPKYLQFDFEFTDDYVTQWGSSFNFESSEEDKIKKYRDGIDIITNDFNISKTHSVDIFQEGLIRIKTCVFHHNYREIVRQYVEFSLALINELERSHMLSKISEVSYSHGTGIFYYKSKLNKISELAISNIDTDFFDDFLKELSDYITSVETEMLNIFKITIEELQKPLKNRLPILNIAITKITSRLKRKNDFNNNLVTLQTSAFRAVINFMIFEKAMERFEKSGTMLKLVCQPKGAKKELQLIEDAKKELQLIEDAKKELQLIEDAKKELQLIEDAKKELQLIEEKIKQFEDRLQVLSAKGATNSRFFKEISHSLTLPIQEYSSHFNHLGIILTIIGIGMGIGISTFPPMSLNNALTYLMNKITACVEGKIGDCLDLPDPDVLTIVGTVIVVLGLASLFIISNLNSLKRPMRGLARTFDIAD